MPQSYGPNFGDRAPLAVPHRERLTDYLPSFRTPCLKLITLSEIDPRTDGGLGRFDRWGSDAVLDHLQLVFVESGRPIERVGSQRPMCLWAVLAP